MILQFILGKPNADQVHMDMLPVVVDVPDGFDLTCRTKADFIQALENEKNDEFHGVIELMADDQVILLDVLKITSIFKKEEKVDETISNKQKKRRK